MNKRIKELVLQAGDDQNKLVKLVIADCVACCAVVTQAAIDARQRVNVPSYLLGRKDGASLCKSTIQKHFGEGK
jgi:hypothetical protein